MKTRISHYLRAAVTTLVFAVPATCFATEMATDPPERLSATNAMRLRRVFERRFPGPLPTWATPEAQDVVESAGIDSSTGSVWVLRGLPGPLMSGDGIGVYEHSLTSGRLLTRVPVRPELIRSTHSRVIFDFAYGQIIIGHSCAVQLATRQVRALAGLPRDLRMPENSVLDSERVLYAQMNRPPSYERLIDMSRRTLGTLGDSTLPNPEHRILSCHGGFENCVLMSSFGTKGASERLYVFTKTRDDMKMAASTELKPGLWARSSCVNADQKWWIVVVEGARGEGHVLIYDIPSLRLVRELPDACFGKVFWVPRTSLIVSNPEKDHDRLMIVDTTSGKTAAVIGPDSARFKDRMGTWRPFADTEGRYVGVHGCEWVQVFAVTGATSRPATQP